MFDLRSGAPTPVLNAALALGLVLMAVQLCILTVARDRTAG